MTGVPVILRVKPFYSWMGLQRPSNSLYTHSGLSPTPSRTDGCLVTVNLVFYKGAIQLMNCSRY